MNGLAALPYYGGKSIASGSGLNEWIRRLLPSDTSATYIEPYAGMLGVLLCRPRAKVEIANDLNERIVNWWRVVREHPEELQQLVIDTPHAESELHACWQSIDEGSSIDRARKMHVVLSCSRIRADRSGRPTLRYSLAYDIIRQRHRVAYQLPQIADRIRDVTLFNRQAVDVLAKSVDFPNTIVYCDPPYEHADTSEYRHGYSPEHRGALIEMLIAHRGRVAISGYRDEWDALGWDRHEFTTLAKISPKMNNRDDPPRRVEVLWTNYPQEQGVFL